MFFQVLDSRMVCFDYKDFKLQNVWLMATGFGFFEFLPVFGGDVFG
jgi:hypothetical protein